jgi:hypothetical protein
MWIPTEEDRRELTDPFHRSTIGRFTVEVKWKRTDQPSGLFTCRVLLDDKYTYEEIQTDDPGKMMSWTIRQMKEVSRRSGERNTTSKP